MKSLLKFQIRFSDSPGCRAGLVCTLLPGGPLPVSRPVFPGFYADAGRGSAGRVAGDNNKGDLSSGRPGGPNAGLCALCSPYPTGVSGHLPG